MRGSEISVRLEKVGFFVVYRTYLYQGGKSGGFCMICVPCFNAMDRN